MAAPHSSHTTYLTQYLTYSFISIRSSLTTTHHSSHSSHTTHLTQHLINTLSHHSSLTTHLSPPSLTTHLIHLTFVSHHPSPTPHTTLFFLRTDGFKPGHKDSKLSENEALADLQQHPPSQDSAASARDQTNKNTHQQQTKRTTTPTPSGPKSKFVATGKIYGPLRVLSPHQHQLPPLRCCHRWSSTHII